MGGEERAALLFELLIRLKRRVCAAYERVNNICKLYRKWERRFLP
jgi:hypothetical protein